jgi:DNA topoisomerase-3
VRVSGKGLIITEKPSVAKDIVAALGGFKSGGGGAYWESDDYVCTFAVGHLFALLEPDEIDPTYKRWSFSTLPIIPAEFKLKPLPEHKQRIAVIRNLVERRDIRFLVNACDAAREGELIFREIVRYTGATQWVKRLWLQSMTAEAIRQGFAQMRDGTDLDGLGAAAECRAKSDWLIGMNATRAFSLRLRGKNDSAPWSVGRVQTPTLAILVSRELEILGHRPSPYFRVKAAFDASTHRYDSVWFDPQFTADDLKPDLRDDRIFDGPAAEAICRAVAGAPAVASETREESKRFAPYLFNLTGLQKYMATRYKWTSKRTLDAAQRCYESHKVITYPRTSSSCLPSDYRGEVNKLIAGLDGDETYGEHARFLRENGLQNTKRNFNDSGVSDHFAIIPTGVQRSLSGDDEKVYDAVVRRFLASFMPPAVYDKVKRITVAAGQHFRTGPVETLMVPGWMQVYRRSEPEQPGEEKLPPLPGKSDVPVTYVSAEIEQKVTVPPPRISEAGLLSLMERAGRHVDDEELAEALMSAEGLGTAATRADIIQNLKTKKYIDQSLRPTYKGIHLIETLRKIRVERLTSAALTGRLEMRLAEVEKDAGASSGYMREVSDYVSDVVAVARNFSVNDPGARPDPVGPCAACASGKIYEGFDTYECMQQGEKFLTAGCGAKYYKNLYGRYLDRNTLGALLTQKKLSGVEGFQSQAGKPATAELTLDKGRIRVHSAAGALADITADSGDKSARAGASAHAGGETGGNTGEAIGPCPIHKDGPGCQVLALRNSYLCEQRLAQLKDKKDVVDGFWLGRMLCGREITADTVQQILRDGRSALIKGFVSKAGNKFNATLVMQPDGKVSFEFEKRDFSSQKGSFKQGSYKPGGYKQGKYGRKAPRERSR